MPVKLLTVGVIIKIIINYALVGIPIINVQGASIGTLVCYAFVSVMALYFLCKETKIRPDLKSTVLKPLFAAICSALSAYAAQGLLSLIIPYKISTIMAIATAVLIYSAVLLLTRTLTENDIKMLPKGEKIYNKLKALRWI